MPLPKLLTLLVLSLSLQAGAKLKLLLLESPQLRVPLLLPARSQETGEQALNRYFRNVAHNPEMSDLFSGQPPALEISQSKELSGDELSQKAVLIGNTGRDFLSERKRLDEFKSGFAENGISSVMIPMVADLGLTVGEKRELRELLIQNTNLLVPMGGEDVEPSLYKQESIWAKDTNLSRDLFELSLIKDYLRRGHGMIMAVCRGHQITAVALGYELIQDVPHQIGDAVNHASATHLIQPLATTHSLLLNLSIASQEPRPLVTTLHHESVRFKPGGPLELAAVASDGVVEALELRNGRGLLLQFHPESMSSLFAKNLFRLVSQKAQASRLQRPLICSKVF